MVFTQSIYTFQRNLPNLNRTLAKLVGLLVLVSIGFVIWLSVHPFQLIQLHPKVFPSDLSSPSTLPTNHMTPPSTMSSSFPQQTLDQFVAEAKLYAMNRLSQSKSDENITIIMGNEAGDLDSAASAISLSFLLSKFGAPRPHTLPPSIYVPLIQSNHDDAQLRPENTAALSSVGIHLENLFCLDDITQRLSLALDGPAFSPSSMVALALVDHPSLTGPWGGVLASNRKVTMVVDHHEDVGDHQDANLRIIDSPRNHPVGSASSLIALLFADPLTKATPSTAIRQVADLLLSAIVIDSDNLRPAPKGKATETDYKAVQLLLPLSSFASSSSLNEIQRVALENSPLIKDTNFQVLTQSAFQPANLVADAAITQASTTLGPYWDILSKSKAMVSHLSGRDLLRRDYKETDLAIPENAAHVQFSLKLGFSSVPIGLAEWLHKDRPNPSLENATDAQAEVEQAWAQWWNVLDAWMNERKIDLAVITGNFRAAKGEPGAGKHKRELVLAFAPRSLPESKSEALWTKLIEGLEKDAHVAPDQVDQRLLLEQPWKGQRLPASAGGKRERVEGVNAEGRRLGAGPQSRWAKVYKQTNAKASRKIVLPAVVSILKTAASKV